MPRVVNMVGQKFPEPSSSLGSSAYFPYESDGYRWVAERRIHGWTLEQIARFSPFGLPFMSRLRDIESGRVAARPDEVEFLTEIYGG